MTTQDLIKTLEEATPEELQRIRRLLQVSGPFDPYPLKTLSMKVKPGERRP